MIERRRIKKIENLNLRVQFLDFAMSLPRLE
jgi:hypothetical protein